MITAPPDLLSADLHLGHRNISAYSGRTSPRTGDVYADVEDMNADLIDTWNAWVSPTDVVWILGDLAMGRIDHSLRLVSRLHGHLVLLKGNHDRGWSGNGRQAAGWDERYRDAGVAEVVDALGPVELAGETVEVSHFPYRGDSQDTERYVEHRPADRGRWLLHGHVHEKWRQQGRMINVGIDAWGGRPVPVDEVAELIAAEPRDLSRLPWTTATPRTPVR